MAVESETKLALCESIDILILCGQLGGKPAAAKAFHSTWIGQKNLKSQIGSHKESKPGPLQLRHMMV